MVCTNISIDTKAQSVKKKNGYVGLYKNLKLLLFEKTLLREWKYNPKGEENIGQTRIWWWAVSEISDKKTIEK